MISKKRALSLAGLVLILIGAGLLFLGLTQKVPLDQDGNLQTLTTRALTVGQALEKAGVVLHPQDRLAPLAGTWLFNAPVIHIRRARTQTIRLEPSGKQVQVVTADNIPANWLALAGVPVYPGDQLSLDGQPIDPGTPLDNSGDHFLQFRQAVPVTIQVGDQSLRVYSSAASLGQALFEAGIYLQSGDQLSLPLDTPLQSPLSVTVQRAHLITIQVDGQTLHSATSAQNVGDALAEANVALQGQDYSQPAEGDPIPANGQIRVVRVREEVQLEQTTIPFETSYQPDPNTELDKRSVVTPGEYGLEVSRVRVRYEDGQEVSRTSDAQWVAKEPVDQVSGYGTKVVTSTLDTPQGQLEYWRAVTVYATSYSPCNSGGSRCYPGTASGLAVQKGVIAVSSVWYSWMVGQRVYIPGYGTAVVADIGGGIPGKYWIDLGYSDADYVPWSQSVTMYFLTPVPKNIPWILP